MYYFAFSAIAEDKDEIVNYLMLAFIDESGDTGFKFFNSSSKYFIVAAVIFADADEAMLCDTCISNLKLELGLSPDYEFHFSHNSHIVRKAFLKAITKYNFRFCAVVIDKESLLPADTLRGRKNNFYIKACELLVELSFSHLHDTTIILDKSGSPKFNKELGSYLKVKFNSKEGKTLRRVKQQDSRSNNLLQLADYIVGVLSRKSQNKQDWEEYYLYVEGKQLGLSVWP